MASESTISTSIIKWINSLDNAWAIKIHSSAMTGRGTPDIAAVVEGKAIWLETKTPDKGSNTTPIQRHNLWRLSEAGAIVGTPRTLSEAKRIIKGITDDEHQS